MVKVHVLHPRFVAQMENDARTQARFHQFMAYFWLLCMAVVPFMSAFNPFTHTGLLLVMEVSLYANFATEYGALSAAQSSLKVDIEHADVVNV